MHATFQTNPRGTVVDPMIVPAIGDAEIQAPPRSELHEVFETLEAIVAVIGGVHLRIIDRNRMELYASPVIPDGNAGEALPSDHQSFVPVVDDISDSLERECIATGRALIQTLERSGDGEERQWQARTRLPLWDGQGNVQAMICISVQLKIPFAALSPAFARVVNELKCGLHLYEGCATLAGLAGLTLREFNRMSKRSFGWSARQLLARTRLEVAAQQLLVGDEGIAGIAHGTGFSDQSAFTRAFSRHFVMTPAAFRRSMKGRGIQGCARMLCGVMARP